MVSSSRAFSFCLWVMQITNFGHIELKSATGEQLLHCWQHWAHGLTTLGYRVTQAKDSVIMPRCPKWD
jgi:hypothetical protein